MLTFCFQKNQIICTVVKKCNRFHIKCIAKQQLGLFDVYVCIYIEEQVVSMHINNIMGSPIWICNIKTWSGYFNSIVRVLNAFTGLCEKIIIVIQICRTSQTRKYTEWILWSVLVLWLISWSFVTLMTFEHFLVSLEPHCSSEVCSFIVSFGATDYLWERVN